MTTQKVAFIRVSCELLTEVLHLRTAKMEVIDVLKDPKIERPSEILFKVTGEDLRELHPGERIPALRVIYHHETTWAEIQQEVPS